MYNDIVLDHFANPRNVGQLTDADGVGRSGNPVDGDTITIYIKVRNETLYDVRFKTFGCGAAIAASSMLTTLSMGKSLEAGMALTNGDVAEALGGLPPQKLLCSNIAADALHAAINDYRAKNKQNHSKDENFSKELTESSADIDETNLELTDRNQIQRYLRHIIIPKISGAGQKKLLDTSVLLCAPSIAACDVLLNYMAACGIGNVYCHLENKSEIECVLKHIHDLNPDIKIKFIDGIDISTDFNIVVGNNNFANQISNLLIELNSPKFSPTLISVAYAWRGHVSLCSDKKSLKNFLSQVSKECVSVDEAPHQEYFEMLGASMSYSFLGTFITIELIKARLNIGIILNEPFYFNLWNALFTNSSSVHKSNCPGLNSFFVNLKQLLAEAKVLIVGTGGLGCPASLTLAKAGIGTIGLIDFDNVDLSNLNRQILHSTSKIGLPKVQSAKQLLKTIAPNINIDLYQTALSRENALNIIKNYDIIVDGLDNLPTRYLLNDACFFQKKPLIEAGALTFYGQVTTIVPDEGPCYRCIFPESETQRSAPSCSEIGVLGPVPGLMGILQAVEAIKIITGFHSTLKGKLLAYDALETEFDIVEFQRNSSCKLCGRKPSILKLGEYNFICKDKISTNNC